MKKFFAAVMAAGAMALALVSTAAAQSSCPPIITGAVLTAAQWQQCFQQKQDLLGYTPLNQAGGTMGGRLVTAAPGATLSGFNLIPGTAPGSPANGDLWATSVGLFVQINGSTVGPLASSSGGPFTGQVQDSGATTTSPGWYVSITGDTVPRIRVGMSATDIASIAFGPGNANRDLFLERAAAANLRLGAPDAAAPVAQTLSAQNVLAGTSNTAGVDFTIAGSRGTGTGAGGKIIFQIAPAGSTGSSQNPLVTAGAIFPSGGIGIGASATDPSAGNLNLGGGSLLNNGTSPTGTGAYVRATSPTLVTPTLGAATATSEAIGSCSLAGVLFCVGGGATIGGAVNVTSPTSQVLVAGPNGAVNPSFNVDASTSSAVNGLNIKAGASGAGVALSAISSATNESLTLNAKGSGSINIGGVSTGGVVLGAGGGGVQATALTALTSFTATGLVGLGNLAVGTQDTVIGYFGSTSASAATLPNCTGALTYSTGTHTVGCNATAGTGTVTSSGTPLANQIAQFTTTTNIQGVNLASLLTGGAGVLVTGTTSPTIATDPAYGSWKLLNTLTASSSANLQDTTSITASFKDYQIVFESITPASSSVDCRIRIQSGGSFQTTGYFATAIFSQGAGVSNATITTYVPCSGNGGRVGNAGGNGISGIVELIGPPTSANTKQLSGTLSYLGSSNSVNELATISGNFNSGATITGVQIDFSSGNISTGVIKIYGRN